MKKNTEALDNFEIVPEQDIEARASEIRRAGLINTIASSYVLTESV